MKKINNDVELNQILFMKKLKLTPHQVAKLTGKRKSDVERVFTARKLNKVNKSSSFFNWSDYNNSMI